MPARPFLSAYRDPEFLADLAGEAGPRHLDADFELVGDTFRRFAEDRIKPVAEHVHRTNGDVPEEVIAGLAEMGVFGLSVPEEYGGFAAGGESDYIGMVVATEELQPRLARHRRLADHPSRDPDAGARAGRHRGAEAALASEARERIDDGRRRRHRARLRVERRRGEDHRSPGSGPAGERAGRSTA